MNNTYEVVYGNGHTVLARADNASVMVSVVRAERLRTRLEATYRLVHSVPLGQYLGDTYVNTHTTGGHTIHWFAGTK